MRKVNGIVYVVMVILVSLVLSAPVLAQVGGDRENTNRSLDITVDPESFEFTITCNETVGDSLCITTPPSGVISAADIVFLFDATGSMEEEIQQVKDSALGIMQAIEDLGIDAAYGVGYFKDYPHLYPWPPGTDNCGYSERYGSDPDLAWEMLQDITADEGTAAAAINAVTVTHAYNDLKENYARALYESRFFSYRFDTTKIVLMFGDAPAHDCDFFPGRTYGWDPGRNEILDGVPPAGDDLDYETVVAQVAADGIHVLALDASLDDGSTHSQHATLNFQYMASETDGAYFLITEASQVPGAILALIGEIAVIHEMSLIVNPGAYDGWVVETPLMFLEVGPEETVCFDIQITVPPETPVGNYSFDLLVDADGETVATVPVLIHRTGASPTENVTWSKIRSMFRFGE